MKSKNEFEISFAKGVEPELALRKGKLPLIKGDKIKVRCTKKGHLPLEMLQRPQVNKRIIVYNKGKNKMGINHRKRAILNEKMYVIQSFYGERQGNSADIASYITLHALSDHMTPKLF